MLSMWTPRIQLQVLTRPTVIGKKISKAKIHQPIKLIYTEDRNEIPNSKVTYKYEDKYKYSSDEDNAESSEDESSTNENKTEDESEK